MPRGFYVAVLGMAVFVAGAVARSPLVAAAGAAAWTAMSAWFAARRLKGSALTGTHIAEMIVTSALIPPLSIYWRIRGSIRFGKFYF